MNMRQGCLSGDFRPLKDINFNTVFLSSISRVANWCDFEICGAVTADKLYFFKNSSKNPKEAFVVNPAEYINFYGDINFFFHSHCLGSAVPSEVDIAIADELLRPFLIYSSKDENFSFYNPKSQKSIYFSL